jgi:nitrogen fixation-related uncharacterized protein
VSIVASLAFAAVVIGAFVWAAKKDGEEDEAIQKRLGFRRKTRMGL